MAEGINFSSESFDDDAEDKKKKKKKKASQDVGAAIVGGSLERPKTVEQPKPNFFDQLRGMLFDTTAEKTTEITDTKDVERLRTVASNEEEAAILRAKEILNPETPAEFTEFRTELRDDELNSGEGVIELHSANASKPEEVSETAAFTHSVEQDLNLIETVESPDEKAAVRQAPQVIARASSRARTNARRAQSQTPVGGAQTSPSNPNSATGPVAQGGNVIPSAPNALPVLLLAQRLALETAKTVGRAKGRVEGLIAGAVIGGGVEHVRHTRHEKKMERRTKEAFAKRDQKIENLEYNHQQLKTEQLELARRAEADKRQIREAAKAEMARTVEEQMTLARTENNAVFEAAKRTAELKEEERKKAETIERLNSQAMEQERQEAERLQGPENRLETSAWHTMEVDKHGHVVEDSKLEYGHEYYRERSHETAPAQQVDAKAGVAAVSSLVGGGSSASSDDSSRVAPGWAPLPSTSQATGVTQTQTDDAERENLDVAALLPWIIILITVGVLIWLLV